MTEGETVAARPEVSDIIANASDVIAGLRGEIDHQSTDAERVDTKATAILTITAAAVPFAISRLQPIDTDVELLAAAVTALALAALVVCLFQALRPRDAFSYDVNPPTAIKYADTLDRLTWLLWAADTLADSREMNRVFLKAKQDWYQRGLRTAVGATIGVSWLVQVGGIA